MQLDGELGASSDSVGDFSFFFADRMPCQEPNQTVTAGRTTP